MFSLSSFKISIRPKSYKTSGQNLFYICSSIHNPHKPNKQKTKNTNNKASFHVPLGLPSLSHNLYIFTLVHNVTSTKIENKKRIYRLVKTTYTKHFSLAELYHTLHIPLFIRNLFLGSVFYFWSLFVMYFTYDVVMLFTAQYYVYTFVAYVSLLDLYALSFLHCRTC